MTDPRIQAIRERHAKATTGEWHEDEEINRAGDGSPYRESQVQAWVGGGTVPAKVCDTLNAYYGFDEDERRANVQFIAHAHQDIPWLLAQLEAAQSQAKEDAALMREAEEVMSRLTPQTNFNLTKWICPMCQSWVWDDDEEHQKPIQHTPDCIVTKLRDTADRPEGEV